MPRRILLNRSYGGFNLSDEAKRLYKEATKDVSRGKHWYINDDVARDDPILIGIVDDIGLNRAGGNFCRLEFVEIPDDVPADGWMIQDYDGMEWVAEKHRRWWPGASPNQQPHSC